MRTFELVDRSRSSPPRRSWRRCGRARRRRSAASRKTAFGTADLAKLQVARGHAGRERRRTSRRFYERYQFANDSTIEITYFGDSTMTRATGNGRVYLSVGRIFHTFGPGRWAATHVDESGAYFVPQTNAHNTFAWSSRLARRVDGDDPNGGLSGHDRVTVYEMQRIGKR